MQLKTMHSARRRLNTTCTVYGSARCRLSRLQAPSATFSFPQSSSSSPPPPPPTPPLPFISRSGPLQAVPVRTTRVEQATIDHLSVKPAAEKGEHTRDLLITNC